MNAFVKGIHAAHGTAVNPAKQRPLEYFSSDASLYLDDAYHTLSLVHDTLEGMDGENPPATHKQLASMYGHIELLVQRAADAVQEIMQATNFTIGLHEFKSIENTLDTLTVLKNTDMDRFPVNVFISINDGLYQTLEVIKENAGNLCFPLRELEKQLQTVH